MEDKKTNKASKSKYRSKRTSNRKTEWKDKEVSANKRADNDSAWYTVNGQLMKDVSSFSFNSALGSDITVNSGKLEGGMQANHFRVPGILSIMTTPTVGASNNINTPVNIAARNIYSFVRHANSGHANYDPADLMVYLLAMDSIYTYWSYMTRVYGTAQIFSQTNRYVGDAYLNAMGVDANSVRTNLADLRAYINMFAVKASAMCVPKTMTYFVRHSWMYSNMYKDEDVSKSQVYMYVPAFLYKYALIGGISGLSAVPVTARVATGGSITGLAGLGINELVGIGDTLLNAVLGQEDMGIMSGDILKAYGPENLWKLSPVPEDYAVFPVFSEEMLAQIHNTSFASATICTVDPENPAKLKVDYHGLDVRQDQSVGDGALYFTPRFAYASHMATDSILDFWKENPTPEEVMVATRNKLSAYPETALTGVHRPVSLDSCGSEIALCAVMLSYNANNILEQSLTYASDVGMLTTSISKITKFNEFPLYYIMATGTGAIADIMGNLDTYTVISQYEVQRLHTTALLSMFGVPYIK